MAGFYLICLYAGDNAATVRCTAPETYCTLSTANLTPAHRAPPCQQ